MDADAVASLYSNKYRSILAALLAEKLPGNFEDTEDAVHEAFASAMADDTGTFAELHPHAQWSWLRTAARRNLLDEKRRQKYQQSKYLLYLTTASRTNPSNSADELDSQLLLRLTSRLTDRQREIVRCRLVLNLTLDEIATRLGITKGAVKSHLSRAKRTLQTVYREYQEEASET